MARRPTPTYRLDPTTSSFSIENYNWAPALSNFLPGIAGRWGIPLWLYYVNRGQAVSSFGVRDKDGQILEFYSFNKATMRVGSEGFRTFIRLDGKLLHEPFLKTDRAGVRQTLVISAAELVLRERDERLGLEIEVAYFPVPNLRIAALVREVRIRNLTRRTRRLECVDGLPRILPYGLDQARIKGIPRHIEGMMGVADVAGVPVFRLKQTPDDTEHVAALTGGHFYLSPGTDLRRGIVVDPEAVFGEEMRYERPWTFEAGGARGVLAAPQLRDNKTPSAFTVREAKLRAGGELAITSIVGYVRRDADLTALRASLEDPACLAAKRAENTEIVDEIADRAFTASASPAFDAYSRQTFLDNVVRGGMPVMFQTADGPSAFYVYSRQNGDLERDYHFFVLDPTYLSQGTGHYRSVLQNRRTDAWFFPDSQDANLRTFLDLIQLDGYNPLEVRGLSYRVKDIDAARRCLAQYVPDADDREPICAWLARSFTPGELVMRLEDVAPRPPGGWEPVMREVLALASENELGGLHEGFWADHWHYNVDLLEVFLMVYPEQLRAVLLERGSYSYFDDPDVIVPRVDRSVDAGGKIRMFGAVVRDPEKLARIRARRERPYTVRTRHGEDEIYRTCLLVKLLTIVINRLATLDPAGVGIEMEGGKPGWNDSMNGLPGLFGSGLSETIELARAIRILETALSHDQLATAEIRMYAELATFMRGLGAALARRVADASDDAALAYWAAANTLKETYRANTRLGIAGDEASVGAPEIRQFLAGGQAVLAQIFDGPLRGRAVSPSGVPYTYFVNDVTASAPTGGTSHLGLPTVEAKAFRQRPVRLFLEGPVHWMKERRHEAAEVYRAVRASPIYDRKLKMYKACESMAGESFELGRAVGAYPRGWIENESIYLHMEYKYLLEILRSGLCAEFWQDAKSALIPFMDPAVYGRSTLEGASFIVSSAYADARLHGRGFQPRLSGITCEFLHIWILAVAGEQPFRTGAAGDLELALAPRLPAWLFTQRASKRRYHDRTDGWTTVELPAKTFAFKLLDRALVVYHNPARAATFGDNGVRPMSYALHYRGRDTVHVDGDVVPAHHAHAVRDGHVRRIDVTLDRARA